MRLLLCCEFEMWCFVLRVRPFGTEPCDSCCLVSWKFCDFCIRVPPLGPEPCDSYCRVSWKCCAFSYVYDLLARNRAIPTVLWVGNVVRFHTCTTFWHGTVRSLLSCKLEILWCLCMCTTFWPGTVRFLLSLVLHLLCLFILVWPFCAYRCVSYCLWRCECFVY